MDNLILEGVNLMMVGMGTVFVFLTLLVMVTMLMSRLVLRIEGPPAPPGSGTGAAEEEVVAAITAALATHRRR